MSELLVSETDIVKDLARLVSKAKDVFTIEKSTGKIFFKNFGKLNDRQRISALLIGRYFAVKLDIIEDSSLGVSEIAELLGRPKTTISGPLKDLLVEGYIEKLSNRKYRIAYNRIKEVFENYFGEDNGSKRRKEKN